MRLEISERKEPGEQARERERGPVASSLLVWRTDVRVSEQVRIESCVRER